jgi:hypothetical protein
VPVWIGFEPLYPLSKTYWALTSIALTKRVRNTESPRRKPGLHWIGIAPNIGVRCFGTPANTTIAQLTAKGPMKSIGASYNNGHIVPVLAPRLSIASRSCMSRCIRSQRFFSISANSSKSWQSACGRTSNAPRKYRTITPYCSVAV